MKFRRISGHGLAQSLTRKKFNWQTLPTPSIAMLMVAILIAICSFPWLGEGLSLEVPAQCHRDLYKAPMPECLIVNLLLKQDDRPFDVRISDLQCRLPDGANEAHRTANFFLEGEPLGAVSYETRRGKYQDQE